jgi:hypothetical protein
MAQPQLPFQAQHSDVIQRLKQMTVGMADAGKNQGQTGGTDLAAHLTVILKDQ